MRDQPSDKDLDVIGVFYQKGMAGMLFRMIDYTASEGCKLEKKEYRKKKISWVGGKDGLVFNNR